MDDQDQDFLEDGNIQERKTTLLDFNANRQGQIPMNHQFSSTQFKNHIENMDLYEWSKQVKLEENDYYSYPSNLDLAELHRQCCYIQPDEEFLKYSQASECPCCKQKLRRKRYNVYFADMYKVLVDEFGITMPLYFTLMKLQIFLQIAIFIIYGIFFVIETKKLCNNRDLYPDIFDNREYDPCQFTSIYIYTDINTFLQFLSVHKDRGYSYYQFATFFIFLINLFLPFLYEIVIRYRQFQYYDKEHINHRHEDKKSVYVKHLPYKMTQQEIQQTISKALALNTHKMISKKSYLFDQETSIQEIVYIYDIHEISEKNKKREELFINTMITVRQVQEMIENGRVTTMTLAQQKNKQLFSLDLLQELLKQQLKDLMFQTQEMKMYLKNGLPFTNKVLIKFDTQEERQAAYIHYQKNWYQNLLIRYEIIKEERKKARDQAKVDIIDARRTLSVDHHEYSIKPSPAQSEQITTLAALQADYTNKYVEQTHKQLRVHKGFKTNEIFWENLGMNTFKRLKYRLKAVATVLLTLLILMGGFEIIYVYQERTKEKEREGYVLSVWERALTIFFSIFVSFLSTYSTLTMLKHMNQSKRSTFSELELSITHFFVFLQYILVNFLPYILTLEIWGGKESVVAIYDLYSLYQSRMIIKQIFHTFHMRHSAFWLQKRRILKNFNPYLYFQGQLNTLLTPPLFPLRGRMNQMLFILYISLTLIYICPIMVVTCIVFNVYLFFYDKFTITQCYQIDRRYNINHMSYFVRSYQFVLLPFNIYIFMKLYWDFGWLTKAGAPIAALVVLLLFFLNKPVVDFIVTKILRQKKRKYINESFQETPFFESYDKFFKKMRVEKLTEQLATIFKETIKK